MVKFAQFCFYFAFHWIFQSLFRAKVVGVENIPKRNFIIAANHTAKIDPFLLCLLPFSVVKRITPIYFLTSEYYYRKWYLYPILKPLGCYPVASRAWTLDEFLGTSFLKLRSGKTIMFFPEGKIVGENPETKARPGIGYLGAKSGKMILPLRIRWGKSFLGIKQVTLLFGQPIFVQRRNNSTDFFKQEAERIMAAIYSL
jgi:1-acyl-sn-glycerol-3-phosphate acyltransferase